MTLLPLPLQPTPMQPPLQPQPLRPLTLSLSPPLPTPPPLPMPPPLPTPPLPTLSRSLPQDTVHEPTPLSLVCSAYCDVLRVAVCVVCPPSWSKFHISFALCLLVHCRRAGAREGVRGEYVLKAAVSILSTECSEPACTATQSTDGGPTLQCTEYSQCLSISHTHTSSSLTGPR